MIIIHQNDIKIYMQIQERGTGSEFRSVAKPTVPFLYCIYFINIMV